MRAAVFFVLIWLAGAAQATQDGWPALHDVTGVAADDVLNIRAAPDAGAEIVGTFDPDATDIEVIRPGPDQRWGLVNTGESTGWTSLAYLRRQPGQWDGAFPAVARCFGTEPFWSLEVQDDTVTFRTPSGETRTGEISARLSSENRRDRHAVRGALGDMPLLAMIDRRLCSDGMSDFQYGLGTDLLIGDRLLSGCCSLTR